MKPRIFISFTLGASLFFFTGCSKSDNSSPPVTDMDGNTYKTVRIGDQTWMAENLKTATFSDGTDIPVVRDSLAWGALNTPGLCWYNNDEDSIKKIFGALYNFHAVSSGKLCPAGWHVPSVDEWQKLMDFLGDPLTGGGRLKEAGTLHWKAPNTGADNTTGFTALPAGIRYFEGSFNTLYYFTSFWSSTEYDSNKGWYVSLYYSDAAVLMNNISGKDGFSVRCLED